MGGGVRELDPFSPITSFHEGIASLMIWCPLLSSKFGEIEERKKKAIQMQGMTNFKAIMEFHTKIPVTFNERPYHTTRALFMF